MPDSIEFSSKKNNPDLAKLACALFDNAISLRHKTSVIWETTFSYLSIIEKAHFEKLKKIFFSIDKRYQYIENLRDPIIIREINKERIFLSKDKLTRCYLGSLFQIEEIRRKFYLTNSFDTIYKNPFSDGFKLHLFHNSNFSNTNFINSIIPEFFPLQLHCYELVKIIDTPKGIPIDEIKRIQRSSIAAHHRHIQEQKFGEDILKNMVLQTIKKISKENKYRNVKEIVDKNNSIFQKILNDYQDRLGSPIKKNGPPLEFGEDLIVDDLVDEIKKWRDDPEFNLILKEYLLLKNKSKAN